MKVVAETAKETMESDLSYLEGQNVPADGASVLAALPRSPLHLRLLLESNRRPDLIFYRDAHLARHMPAEMISRAIFLDRERRWPGGGSLRTVRRRNAAYYRAATRLLQRWRFHRLIIFLESEPLENLVRDHVGDSRIELWEDGLSHYTDFHGPAYDLLRSSVQGIAGFYPHRILHRRAKRNAFAAVRDRFVTRDLPTTVPGPAEPAAVQHDAVLIIGAPLVQDRLVTRRRYLDTIERIVTTAAQPVVYYPHPREDIGIVTDLERMFGGAWFRVQQGGGDLVTHSATNRYQAYIAAFSTALLDVASLGPGVYCPLLFGLKRVHRRMADLDFLPVKIVAEWSELGAFLEDAQRTALQRKTNEPLKPKSECNHLETEIAV